MQANHLKQLRTLSLVLACGALAVGCAGNSVKPMEPETTQLSSTNTEQPIVQSDKQANEQMPVSEADNSEGSNNIDTAETAQPADTKAQSDTQPADTQAQNDIQPAQASEQPGQLAFYFGFNKSELAPQDLDVLKQHARFLKDNPMLVLEINGHTDSSGPHAYNEYLSKLRAESVAKVLIDQGVSRSQLVINALADDKPLADAKKPGQNRRVDLQYDEVNQVSSK